jgi:hypothetical protein
VGGQETDDDDVIDLVIDLVDVGGDATTPTFALFCCWLLLANVCALFVAARRWLFGMLFAVVMLV